MDYKYRTLCVLGKKPVEIEAFQMTKERRWDNSDWPDWLHEAWNRDPGENALCPNPDVPPSKGHKSADELVYDTLEGVHKITFDDYIIRGVDGEICPCELSIFEKTYEKI